MNISIFYEKGDTSKILKELTYNIGNVSVELKQANDNRMDFDIEMVLRILDKDRYISDGDIDTIVINKEYNDKISNIYDKELILY